VGGLDENLNVSEQGILTVHQLRQLALDVYNDQATVLYIEHIEYCKIEG